MGYGHVGRREGPGVVDPETLLDVCAVHQVAAHQRPAEHREGTRAVVEAGTLDVELPLGRGIEPIRRHRAGVQRDSARVASAELLLADGAP